MIDWIAFSDRVPRIDGHVLLLFNADLGQPIVATGRYRLGRFGEPSQCVYGWRCDCCGRFGNPSHWAPMPGIPGNREGQ